MKSINLLVLFIFVVFASTAFAADKAHWGYSGEHGPEHWSEISNDYQMCGLGKNQSPIDLKLGAMAEAELEALKFSYEAGALSLVNNGHAIQLNYPEGSRIEIDGKNFALKQFHFHGPSENQIDSKSYPLEAHLVHSDKDGNLAVIALMFEEGKENSFLSTFWADLPKKAGAEFAVKNKMNVKDMLPADTDYYRFDGSLTTPPCSEGVRWFVMKKAAQVSKGQIEKFRMAIPFKNNRPVQGVNARLVLK